MKLGSLFSGGGLGDFGFMAAGFDIRWQVEIDEYCQKILALRYPESEKYRDIKTLRGSDLEKVDIIMGGFPCQPFSVAGRQKGKDDNRYLWPEMLRVIDEVRPRWVVGENVPGIINLALDTVCADLESKGYEVWPIVFPAHALGAWHKRDRLWIICHAKHNGQPTSKDAGILRTGSDDSNARKIEASQPSGSSEQYAPVADSKRKGLEGQPRNGKRGDQSRRIETEKNGSTCASSLFEDVADSRRAHERIEKKSEWASNYITRQREIWITEPNVGRVANGIADRVHRLKMLGNGQVPACTYVIGEFINEVERTINQGG
jgi:DNA (cytosine-5)-methyltransferase 1